MPRVLENWQNRDAISEIGFTSLLPDTFDDTEDITRLSTESQRQNINLYYLVANDPVDRADYLGLCDVQVNAEGITIIPLLTPMWTHVDKLH